MSLMLCIKQLSHWQLWPYQLKCRHRIKVVVVVVVVVAVVVVVVKKTTNLANL